MQREIGLDRAVHMDRVNYLIILSTTETNAYALSLSQLSKEIPHILVSGKISEYFQILEFYSTQNPVENE